MACRSHVPKTTRHLSRYSAMFYTSLLNAQKGTFPSLSSSQICLLFTHYMSTSCSLCIAAVCSLISAFCFRPSMSVVTVLFGSSMQTLSPSSAVHFLCPSLLLRPNNIWNHFRNFVILVVIFNTCQPVVMTTHLVAEQQLHLSGLTDRTGRFECEMGLFHERFPQIDPTYV